MWCLDDRRHRVRVHHKMDPGRNALLRRIVPLRDRLGYYIRATVLVLSATFLLAIVLLAVDSASRGDLIAVTIAFVLCGLALAVVAGPLLARLFLHTVAPRAREARLCPCCGYNLAGCPRDDDGCTPCPECGAAWKVPEAAGTEGRGGTVDG